MLFRFRSVARQFLVTVIRRTTAPRVTTREVYDRLVAELDTALLSLRADIAVASVARDMRVEESAGDAWRSAVGA